MFSGFTKEMTLLPTDYGTVVIAVLTYQRPDDIALVLPRLLEQAASVSIKASVLVVDNDPGGNARSVVESFDSPNLRYANETHPGISAARNRALAESVGTDLLAFIDDDELPVENWLNFLLAQYAITQPAAVVGPVISEYAHKPSAWIEEGEFFQRRRLASGTERPAAATNNLLLDLRQIRAMGLTFDERFGLSGGSDTLFTRQIVEKGGRIVWCNDAVVIDRVPSSRLTQQWILRRSLRSGNSSSRVAIELASDHKERLLVRVVLAVRGGIRMVTGTARFLIGLPFKTARHRAKGLQTTARGVGMLSGAFGYVYSEYRRKSK